MMFEVVLIFIFNLIHLPRVSSVACPGPYQCAGRDIVSLGRESRETISCYGYRSCVNTSIIAYNYTQTRCSGSYACHKARSLSQLSPNPTSFDCSGLFSCAEVGNMYNLAGSIGCTGELSCYQSNITVNSQVLW